MVFCLSTAPYMASFWKKNRNSISEQKHTDICPTFGFFYFQDGGTKTNCKVYLTLFKKSGDGHWGLSHDVI